MSWKDKVPKERIALSRVRDGTMDEDIRGVLSEADEDSMFPRLPPVTYQEPDRNVVVPTWPYYRLLSLTHLGLAFGHRLHRNEAIFGLLAVALVPGGPMVGADMVARPGLRLTPRSRWQSKLWLRSPSRCRQKREPGWLMVSKDITAAPDPRPLTMDALVRFGRNSLLDIVPKIYAYGVTGDYENDLSRAMRAPRAAIDTMLTGLSAVREYSNNTQQGEET